jgi:hypothetical protein
MTIDKYQRQTFCTDLGEHLLNHWVLRKCVGVLGEIKPFNLNPLGLNPIEVRCEPWQHGIHLRAANARRTAHRGIKNLKDYH